MSAPATTLYVPVHKRAGSNASSPSSPPSTLPSDTPSYVYSRATLLSLQPIADESMKGKIRVTCPEVVMTRKMRKALEFHGKRPEPFSAAQQLVTQAPTPPSDTSAIHKKATTAPNPTRVLPRRSRPARRNPFSSSFGVRRTGDDSWRLQAVPMSPVLMV